jgi:hypothetical protein
VEEPIPVVDTMTVNAVVTIFITTQNIVLVIPIPVDAVNQRHLLRKRR